MREWLNRAVSKTVEGVTPPWVRIPPSPPAFIELRQIDRHGGPAARAQHAPRKRLTTSHRPQATSYQLPRPTRFTIGDTR